MKRLCSVLLVFTLIATLFISVPVQAATIVAKGIDVSYWQGGSINWSAVAADSHGNFAILRAYCYGKDTYFDTNYANAKAAGVPVGAYVYIYGTTTAAVQAEINALLSVIQGKQFEYPIYIDIEDYDTYGSVGSATTTALVKMACEMLWDAGFYPGVYTYTSFAASYIDMTQLTAYTTWIADYRGYVGYTGAYDMWQYGCEGSVGGISPVDVNYCYADLPRMIADAGKNGYDSVSYPYDVDDSTKMLYDGESTSGLKASYDTAISVETSNKTQGESSLKLTFNNPAGDTEGKIGGMILQSLKEVSNIRSYNYFEMDVYFSRYMSSGTLQINFAANGAEIGYSYELNFVGYSKGWHTIRVALSDIPAKLFANANWRKIDTIRYTWFNTRLQTQSTYFLIDNVRVLKVEEVVSSLPSSEPSSQPSSIPSPEPSSVSSGVPEEILPYGDINENGAVNATDALAVLKYAVAKQLFTDRQILLADVDGDGTIDAKDALLILRYAVSLIDSFPVETM